MSKDGNTGKGANNCYNHFAAIANIDKICLQWSLNALINLKRAWFFSLSPFGRQHDSMNALQPALKVADTLFGFHFRQTDFTDFADLLDLIH